MIHDKGWNLEIFSASELSLYIPQYQRESEKQELSVEEPEARMSNLKSYDLDESGIPHGMYSGKCEFCKKDIKPFPTVEQQQKVFNPLSDMPLVDSSKSTANKDMTSKTWTNGDTVI